MKIYFPFFTISARNKGNKKFYLFSVGRLKLRIYGKIMARLFLSEDLKI